MALLETVDHICTWKLHTTTTAAHLLATEQLLWSRLLKLRALLKGTTVVLIMEGNCYLVAFFYPHYPSS